MSSTKEIWRPVPGYEGRYQVSNLGRVRSLRTKRVRHASGEVERVRAWFQMKLQLSNRSSSYRKQCIKEPQPYVSVLLVKNDSKKHINVHRLVMLSFVGPCPQGMCVDHKDGNKHNNRLSNLEYVTLSENLRRAYASGLHLGPHRKAVLVERAADGHVREFPSVRSAARFLGLKHSALSEALMRHPGRAVLTKVPYIISWKDGTNEQ